jgi:hypothetical protein
MDRIGKKKEELILNTTGAEHAGGGNEDGAI